MFNLASRYEENILTALRAQPHDPLNWLALRDVRLEQGDRRGELLCLHLRLRADQDGPQREEWRGRLTELLLAGVPFGLPRLSNSVGMEFALVPPGRFLMGSPEEEANREEDEQQHEVEITRAFWLGVDPVTVGQFRAFVQATKHRIQSNWQNPGFRQDDTHPVVCVSWDDAQQFCTWLTKKEPGLLYRLPTEAEWEYACRGGASESYPFHIGQPLHSLSSIQANFCGDFPHGGAAKGPYLKQTTPVRSYPANAWGLFDMHGNVTEWCQDWYDDDYYQQSPPQDPPGPSQGSDRVIRGGGWYSIGQYCRSAYRRRNEPTLRNSSLGFRVALVLSGS